MSVGAICFTSSNSNGSCWVFLAPPPPAFGNFFFPYTTFSKQKVYTTYTPPPPTPNKFSSPEKNHDLGQQKKATYTYFRN